MGKEKKVMSQEDIKSALFKLSKSGVNMAAFVVRELASKFKDGEIDITQAEASQSIETFTTAVQTEDQKNRGVGVLSFPEAQKDLKKDLQKLLDKGADEQLCQKIQQEFDDIKKRFEDELKTVGGTSLIMREGIIKQIILDKADFYYLGNNNDPRAMNHSEKMDYVYAIQEIVEPLPEEVLKIMLNKEKTEEQNQIKSLIYQSAVEAFSTNNEIKDGWAELDKEKFKNPLYQSKFNGLVKSNLNTFFLVNEAIKSVENEKSITLTPERQQKIFSSLEPALSQLDPLYVKENRAAIVKDLETDLNKGIRGKRLSLKGRGRSKSDKEMTISDSSRAKIAKNLLKAHQAKSDEYVAEFTEGKLIAAKLSNEAVKEKVELFASNDHINLPENFSHLDNSHLAELRKQDPALFDVMVLGIDDNPEQTRQSRSSTSINAARNSRADNLMDGLLDAAEAEQDLFNGTRPLPEIPMKPMSLQEEVAKAAKDRRSAIDTNTFSDIEQKEEGRFDQTKAEYMAEKAAAKKAELYEQLWGGVENYEEEKAEGPQVDNNQVVSDPAPTDENTLGPAHSTPPGSPRARPGSISTDSNNTLGPDDATPPGSPKNQAEISKDEAARLAQEEADRKATLEKTEKIAKGVKVKSRIQLLKEKLASQGMDTSSKPKKGPKLKPNNQGGRGIR